jgi:hypothetical protein
MRAHGEAWAHSPRQRDRHKAAHSREDTRAAPAEGIACRLPHRPDPSDAGAGRRPAGPGSKGGVSLADLQQRLHHDAAGLYADRQGLEFPYPLARPDQHPGRGPRQRRPDLREDGKDAGQGRNARQCGFTAYSKKGPFIHRSTNTAAGPFNNLVIALLKPGPGSFTPQARDVPGYRQLFDNERVRAWRLQLEPGQSAGPITQTAPGLRVILDGDELVEIIKGEMDRPLALRSGDFYWQEPGATRAIKNSGTTAINLVEFELK